MDFIFTSPIFVFIIVFIIAIVSQNNKKKRKQREEQENNLRQQQFNNQRQQNNIDSPIDRVVSTIKSEIANALDLKNDTKDQLITCPYCSGIYKKEELKCPNCGATTIH